MMETRATNELQVSLQSLPTCQRCQRLRKKCDSQLPACRLCERAKVECCFMDHALQQVLPRKYIYSLLSRLNNLNAVHAAAFPNGSSGPHAQENADSTSTTEPPPNPISGSGSLPPAGEPVTFDNLFTIAIVNGTTSRFHGSSSVFSLTVAVLARASSSSLYTPSPMLEICTATDTRFEDLDGLHRQRTNDLFRDMVHSLLTLYMSSIGTIYPFVDESLLGEDVEAYFELRARPDFDSVKLEGNEAYQYFRVTMMCAIACSSKSRHQPHLLAYGNGFYSEAVRSVEEVTSEVSSRSLQALLFLAVYCLFSPRKGNVWKLLDFVCRLSVQLGYHTEQHSELEDERQKTLRRNTFWALYSIERLLGQFLGRPSDLPEPIISTEHPTVAAISPSAGDAMIQTFSAAHVFRLMYLRSEIYTDVYLPAKPPLHDLDWFIDRYSALLHWYREVEPFKDATGCGTVTCNVLLHSSIIFLFQPLILRALSHTGSSTSDVAPLEAIPSESYHSACKLIRIYDKIVRASEDSELSLYPMTFLSAYSIWLAAMTLMAHCLLTIDCRTETLARLPNDSLPRKTQKIDYSDLFGLSGTCLILLAWCAEKWPGMEGMMDAYQRLSEKILPLLMQNGHVYIRHSSNLGISGI